MLYTFNVWKLKKNAEDMYYVMKSGANGAHTGKKDMASSS